MPPTRPLFLLSDFGLRDTYVGQMRAVIAGLAPEASVHDLVHELPPQDLVAGAYALETVWPWLPDGAVVCAVVDPGVGTSREAIGLRVRRDDGSTLFAVAPDNGLLDAWLTAADDVHAVVLREGRAPASRTFHGRDVFAPAAARIASGAELEALGDPCDAADLVRLPRSEPERTDRGWIGRTIYVDRFGTLVTNLRRHPHLGDATDWHVDLGAHAIGPLRRTFGDVDDGRPLALVGSSGRLEIAVRNGSAHRRFGVGTGAEVRVRR